VEATTDQHQDISPNGTNGRVTFTRQEAAQILGIGLSTLDVLTKAGRIGVCRSGRRRLYLQRHFDAYLESIESEPEAA